MFVFGGISGAFLCVPACFFWCGFPVFLSCFFWCLLVILLVVFFVLFRVLFPLYSDAFFRAFVRACPFSFLNMFPLGGGPVFCRAFFGGFWVLFSVLFFVFFLCFFCAFYRAFFRAFFRSFSCFFSCFFFVPWAAPKTSNHNILHFGPCVFLVLFLVVTLVKIGYTQAIYSFMYLFH